MLGQRLREARELKKLKQVEVAPLLGITSQALSNYERGGRDPDTDTLNKLAEIYQVTTDYLLGSNNSKYTTQSKEDKKPKDLIKFLDQSEVMFDGETYNLDEDDKKKLREALEYAFWHAKQKNKRKK